MLNDVQFFRLTEASDSAHEKFDVWNGPNRFKFNIWWGGEERGGSGSGSGSGSQLQLEVFIQNLKCYYDENFLFCFQLF